MFFREKGIRSWFAALIFLTLVVGLIFFLTFFHIPDKNKDIITSIIGMIVGSISTAISIFVGRDPDDLKQLKEELAALNDDRSTLISRLRDAQIDKDMLRRQHEHLQNQVIDKLSVFVGRENLHTLGKNDIPEEVARWIPNENPPPAMTPMPMPSDAPTVSLRRDETQEPNFDDFLPPEDK